ncbi:hypothetical protein GCM10023143_25850 [Compostibacter hankyongensis]|uniref:Uncharacterized protein n=1 Tax=Compostibacter hankyongensis TaxID=1007089 RepID=A0ABP8G0U6_9BACT
MNGLVSTGIKFSLHNIKNNFLTKEHFCEIFIHIFYGAVDNDKEKYPLDCLKTNRAERLTLYVFYYKLPE